MAAMMANPGVPSRGAVRHFRAAFVHYADVDASFAALPDAAGAAQERAHKRRRGE